MGASFIPSPFLQQFSNSLFLLTFTHLFPLSHFPAFIFTEQMEDYIML